MNNDIQVINDEKITVNMDGNEVECDILFTYDAEDADASYIAYTDNSTGPDGSLMIRFAKCNAFTNMKYVEVVDESELKMLDGVLQEIIANQDKL